MSEITGLKECEIQSLTISISPEATGVVIVRWDNSYDAEPGYALLDVTNRGQIIDESELPQSLILPIRNIVSWTYRQRGVELNDGTQEESV